MASEAPGNRYFATDRSLQAVKLAKENAHRHDLGGCIRFWAGEWFESIRPSADVFDVIVSNPPYIRAEEIKTLAPEIREFEPRIALEGGEDGLLWIRHIIRSAPPYLKPGGILILEIGHDQREQITLFVSEVGGYDDIQFSKDYSGYDRIFQLRKESSDVGLSSRVR